jgi:PAS domain S-box-containing protein
MSYHKLLERQIRKYLPGGTDGLTDMGPLLQVISESYDGYDRDKELAERAFRISEEEYIEINEKLKHEVEVRKRSVEKLKEAVSTITGENMKHMSDNPLMIARHLNRQVLKRKNAEKVFTTLITNLQSGILLEDSRRRIVFCNQLFCDLFGIQANPDSMQGQDCSQSAGQSKHLFKDPDDFVQHIDELLVHKKLVSGDILELVDGRIFERDYIPVYVENVYKGHLWSYTDITERKRAEMDLRRISAVASANENGVVFTSADGKIFWSNEGFSKLTGYAAEEIMGKTPIELCRGPLSDKEALREMVEKFTSGKSFNIEVIHYRKDGSWFWGRAKGQSIVDEHHKTIQYFAFVEDISLEKEAKAKIREYEERFRVAHGRDDIFQKRREFARIQPGKGF